MWLFLIVNLVGYCSFWALSAVVFEANTRELTAPAALVCATWVASDLCWVAGASRCGLPRDPGRWAIRAVPRFLPLGHHRQAAVTIAAGDVFSRLWDSSGGITFWSAYGLVHAIEPETICEPAKHLLGTPRFGVIIDRACSGYQGIGLIITLLGFYLWCFRRSLNLSRALLLLPMGVVAIWTANVIRIAALVLIGDRISAEVAVGGFHSQAGCIMFNLVGLGLIAVSLQVPWFRPGHHVKSDAATPLIRPCVFLAPQVALIATMMLTAAMSAGFDWAYPLRIVAVVLVLTAFRRSYSELMHWTWSWPAVGYGVGVFGRLDHAGRADPGQSGRPDRAQPPRRHAHRSGSGLGRGPRAGIGRDRADRRGTRVSRVPDPPLDFERFYRGGCQVDSPGRRFWGHRSCLV